MKPSIPTDQMPDAPFDPNANWIPLQDRTAIVQPDWAYSYDGGGFPGVIPDLGPVQPEMVGKPAHEAACAWEYFRIPGPPLPPVLGPPGIRRDDGGISCSGGAWLRRTPEGKTLLILIADDLLPEGVNDAVATVVCRASVYRDETGNACGHSVIDILKRGWQTDPAEPSIPLDAPSACPDGFKVSIGTPDMEKQLARTGMPHAKVDTWGRRRDWLVASSEALTPSECRLLVDAEARRRGKGGIISAIVGASGAVTRTFFSKDAALLAARIMLGDD